MWRNLSGNAKFSIVAFLLTLALGLLSMGRSARHRQLVVANRNLDHVERRALQKRAQILHSDVQQPLARFGRGPTIMRRQNAVRRVQ